MALVELLFGNNRGVRIGDSESTQVTDPSSSGLINLDAAITQEHRFSANATQHPVESGADVTDHVIDMPDQLTINGVFSNTPILFLASLQGSPKRAEEAFEKLDALKKTGKTVDVFTTIKVYRNMIITSLTARRSASIGNAINVDIGLLEIRTARVEETTVDSGPKNLGKKAKSPAKANNAAQAQQKAPDSLLFSGVSSLFGG